MALDLSTLLDLVGMLAGAIAIVVGVRAKLDSIYQEVKHLNETLSHAVDELDRHDRDILDLKWHTGFRRKGGAPDAAL